MVISRYIYLENKLVLENEHKITWNNIYSNLGNIQFVFDSLWFIRRKLSSN